MKTQPIYIQTEQDGSTSVFYGPQKEMEWIATFASYYDAHCYALEIQSDTGGEVVDMTRVKRKAA